MADRHVTVSGKNGDGDITKHCNSPGGDRVRRQMPSGMSRAEFTRITCISLACRVWMSMS